jgi:hypothetical protein
MLNDHDTAKASVSEETLPLSIGRKGHSTRVTISNPALRTIGTAELAQIVGKMESTLKKELTTNPDRYPPRFRPPGSNKILWLERVVIDWLDKVQNGCWQEPKRRTGRRRQVPA